MNVFDERRRPVKLGHSVGQGGEATVYRIEGRADLLAKIFEPAPRPNYEAKLAWMMAHQPDNPTQASNHASLAWPCGLLYGTDRRLAGYLMPYVRQSVPALAVFNPRRRSRILPTFDRRYLYRAARNLSTAAAALHLSGYVVGDLNESNILINPSALVTLIDTDSFQVQAEERGRLTVHHCPVGKLEYTPPELQGRSLEEVVRLPEHDNFAMAVLIFQLLMDGSHPFRAQWLGSGDPPALEVRIRQGLFPYAAKPAAPIRPPRGAPSLDTLHPELAELFRTCFIEGHALPARRPTAQDWRKALREAEKDLRQCSRGHYYSVNQGGCPTCSARTHPASSDRPGPRPQPAPARPVESEPRPAADSASPGRTAPPPQRPRGRYRQAPPPRPTSPPRSAPSWSGVSRPVQTAPNWGNIFPNTHRLPPAVRVLQRLIQYYPYTPTYPIRPAPAAGTGPAGAPAQARPAPSQPVSTIPSTPVSPAWPPAPTPVSSWLRTWVQPRLQKSVLVGGSLGALIGALPGLLYGSASSAEDPLAIWALFWVLGGASAGLWRGYKPGYRLGLWIERRMGWERFWTGAGMVNGAIIGTLIGGLFWWAIFPIFLGFLLGVRLGSAAGRTLWQAGKVSGWERIMGIIGSVITAGLGGSLAGIAAGSMVGSYAYETVPELIKWLFSSETGYLYKGLLMGAMGGALGGGLSGFLADLFARLSGLVD